MQDGLRQELLCEVTGRRGWQGGLGERGRVALIHISFWAITEGMGRRLSASWALWLQGGPSALEWIAHFWQVYVPLKRWGHRLLPLQGMESELTHSW